MKYLTLFLLLIPFSMSAQNQDPWSVYMTPNDVHDLFAKYTGDFELIIEMQGMDKPIVLESSQQMILGGRFLELKQKGNMMGMDYASLYTIGYNTIDKTVSMTTITNMGTGTLALQGSWDADKKVANLHGKLTNPVSKETINVRQTINFVDDNTILIESFDQEGDQPEKKTVVYKFVRK